MKRVRLVSGQRPNPGQRRRLATHVWALVFAQSDKALSWFSKSVATVQDQEFLIKALVLHVEARGQQ
jgi:hypothetical protein